MHQSSEKLIQRDHMTEIIATKSFSDQHYFYNPNMLCMIQFFVYDVYGIKEQFFSYLISIKIDFHVNSDNTCCCLRTDKIRTKF